jgi:hypothetical protein
MSKLKLRLQNIEGAEILSREQLRDVLGGGGGGEPGSGNGGGCGIQVNGVWHPSGLGAAETLSLLGQTVTEYDPNNWSPDGGFTILPGGSYSGTADHWCCYSCPWNVPGEV